MSETDESVVLLQTKITDDPMSNGQQNEVDVDCENQLNSNKIEEQSNKVNEISEKVASPVVEQGKGDELDFGLELDELYKIAFKFYKENESKAFHPSYDNRNALVAYTLHVKHGPFLPEKAPPLGTLDIVGYDRRQSWLNLGNLPKDSAKKDFIKLLNNLCPLFLPYVEAHKCDLEEKKRILREEEEKERIRQEKQMEAERLEMEKKRKSEEQMRQFDAQKQKIQEALNRQTFQQFKTYAEQQYPSSPEQQETLIRQLQEQHYQQYMQQMLQNQLQQKSQLNRQFSNQQQLPQQQPMFAMQNGVPVNSYQKVATAPEHYQIPDAAEAKRVADDSDTESGSERGDETVENSIAGASMWTRKNVQLFKESIRSEGGDGIIKVGHGEIVTVRVPTHQDGTCIFWEFATDSYDIGFGLLFEWTKNPGNQVSVHISESEDEEEDEEEGDIETGDVEKGAAESASPRQQLIEQTPVSCIIPIYRRDCHEEVYAGSHAYPGKGVYLLKFDNSYSLWRSKSLYYRVFYTK